MPHVTITLSDKEFEAFGRKLGPNPYGKKQEVVSQLIREWVGGERPVTPRPSPFVELAATFEAVCRHAELLETVREIMARHVGPQKKSSKIA